MVRHYHENIKKIVEMANIKNYLTIDAGASKIYEAITTENGIKNWWTDDCSIKPEIGFINEFRFDKGYCKYIEVTNLEEGKRVDWKFVDGNEEWMGTVFSFEIMENDGKSDLRFYHNNWKEETDYFGVCSYHWGRFMASLKSYVETGLGQPFKSEAVNNN